MLRFVRWEIKQVAKIAPDFYPPLWLIHACPFILLAIAIYAFI